MYYPTIEEVEDADAECEGICKYCGNRQPAEPDARAYTCENCGKQGVFGAAEFALRGWVK